MKNYILLSLIFWVGYSCIGREKTEETILRKVTRDYIKAFSDQFPETIVMEDMLDNIHILIWEESLDVNNVLQFKEECKDSINSDLRLFTIFYGNSYSDVNIENLSRIWKEGKYYVLFSSLQGPYLNEEVIPKELQRVSDHRLIKEDTEWLVAICKKNMKYKVIPNPYSLPPNCIEELNNFKCE